MLVKEKKPGGLLKPFLSFKNPKSTWLPPPLTSRLALRNEATQEVKTGVSEEARQTAKS